MTTYCDVNTCEDCPRYGDDCDGDKRVEHTDYISRADAIEALSRSSVYAWSTEQDLVAHSWAIRILQSLPSADAEPKVKHDREWIIGCIKHDGFIKTDRFDKANQIILDALSADAVPQSEQYKKGFEDAKRAYEIELARSTDAVQGEWIDVKNEPYCECSVCGSYIDNLDDDYAFCPRCGARMKGGAE